jgi:hypothetical protein
MRHAKRARNANAYTSAFLVFAFHSPVAPPSSPLTLVRRASPTLIFESRCLLILSSRTPTLVLSHRPGLSASDTRPSPFSRL